MGVPEILVVESDAEYRVKVNSQSKLSFAGVIDAVESTFKQVCGDVAVHDYGGLLVEEAACTGKRVYIEGKMPATWYALLSAQLSRVGVGGVWVKRSDGNWYCAGCEGEKLAGVDVWTTEPHAGGRFQEVRVGPVGEYFVGDLELDGDRELVVGAGVFRGVAAAWLGWAAIRGELRRARDVAIWEYWGAVSLKRSWGERLGWVRSFGGVRKIYVVGRDSYDVHDYAENLAKAGAELGYRVAMLEEEPGDEQFFEVQVYPGVRVHGGKAIYVGEGGIRRAVAEVRSYGMKLMAYSDGFRTFIRDAVYDFGVGGGREAKEFFRAAAYY